MKKILTIACLLTLAFTMGYVFMHFSSVMMGIKFPVICMGIKFPVIC